MKPLAFADSKHTPARCGAAGVISLLGGFGGPHPHCRCFDLSREIDENKRGLEAGEAPRLMRRTIKLMGRSWCAPAGLGIGGLVVAVLQHLQFFQRDEAAIHHPIENGQEFVDLGFGIHDLDHQRQIE
jgi:hypothetical protein